jgi:hypothetical protein
MPFGNPQASNYQALRALTYMLARRVGGFGRLPRQFQAGVPTAG